MGLFSRFKETFQIGKSADYSAVTTADQADQYRAYAGNWAIYNAVIPDGITKIAEGAFADCEEMTWTPDRLRTTSVLFRLA